MIYIPDISYHLAFCFLSLKELTRIAQCCREWKRIVTETSFLNMFHYSGTLRLAKKRRIQYASKSQFRHVIRNINLDTIFNSALHLIQFRRLESLILRLEWNFVLDTIEFDITPVFQALGPRLSHLTIQIFSSCQWSYSPPFFLQLQQALSLLTSLTSLNLFNSRIAQRSFNDISFLTQMTQLKSLSCDDIYTGSTQDFICQFMHLPNLNHLILGETWHHRHSSSEFTLPNLRAICLLFGKNKLKHFGKFRDLPHSLHDGCEQLLNTMSHLETIDISVSHCKIPTLLGKWIHHLEIEDRTFRDDDVRDIVGLYQLKSLRLISCYIFSSQLNYMIDELASRLEFIHIVGMIQSRNFISFQSISNCKKLKSFEFTNLSAENRFDFSLITKCKELETIRMRYCNIIKTYDLSEHMQEALKIPSNVFPKLKLVEIH
jgi:Leucine-rich repeat (LRR) protein